MNVGLLAHEGGKGGDPVLMRVVAEFQGACAQLGHRVETVTTRDRNGPKLTGFQYLVVFARASGTFRSKSDPALRAYLKGAGQLEGKRTCAVLLSRGPFRERALCALMRDLEGQGMIVTYSDSLAVPQEAPLVARKLFAEE